MGRKLALPMLTPRPSPPSVDVMRKRLGGRAMTESGAGDVVTFTTDGGVRHSGVVVFVGGDELDVCIDEHVVRRVRRSQVNPADVALSQSFLSIAECARTFASLSEGQRVQFVDGHLPEEGILVEKCRFGALVERADGKIIGLGFRRLAPVQPSSSLLS